MTWESFQNAVHAALVSASGISGERVRWERASRDQPATSGDVLVISVGDDSADPPEYSAEDTANPSPGNYVTLHTDEQIDRVITVDYYAMGATAARGALTATFRGLRRETVQDALEAAGVALVSTDSVQSLPALLETEFRDRARGSFTVRLSDGTTEGISDIHTATVTSTWGDFSVVAEE